MGARPPGIIATDLTRETAKYREAHNKANESNQNLHRAVTTHVANLEILCMPLAQLQHQIPGLELSNNRKNSKTSIMTVVDSVHFCSEYQRGGRRLFAKHAEEGRRNAWPAFATLEPVS